MFFCEAPVLFVFVIRKLSKSQSNVEKACVLQEEELKWYKRYKSKFIFKGDSNTRYFHDVANGRRRKKCIHSLVQDECIIEGQEHLKSYISNYYKNMFGTLDEETFSMDETRMDDIPQISMEDNDLLIAEYSEEEVRKTVSKMEHNKVPDGFPAEFYQIFLGTIKSDLLELFSCLDN
jgi:mannosylglycoprotein endo-beta-mannosidase